jgi:hypothetical protein
VNEVLRAEETDGEQAEAETPVEEDLHLPIGEKSAHRRPNGAIGGWDAKD